MLKTISPAAMPFCLKLLPVGSPLSPKLITCAVLCFIDADSFKNAVMEQIDLYESEKLKEQAAQMAQMAQFAGFKQQ